MKRVLLTLSLLLLPTMAQAQQLDHSSKEISLKLTLPEAELVWNGLRKLPVEQVEVLMNKIRSQVAEQTKPVEKEPEKK